MGVVRMLWRCCQSVAEHAVRCGEPPNKALSDKQIENTVQGDPVNRGSLPNLCKNLTGPEYPMMIPYGFKDHFPPRRTGQPHGSKKLPIVTRLTHNVLRNLIEVSGGSLRINTPFSCSDSTRGGGPRALPSPDPRTHRVCNSVAFLFYQKTIGRSSPPKWSTRTAL
jgi:hypothetical protein